MSSPSVKRMKRAEWKRTYSMRNGAGGDKRTADEEATEKQAYGRNTRASLSSMQWTARRTVVPSFGLGTAMRSPILPSLDANDLNLTRSTGVEHSHTTARQVRRWPELGSTRSPVLIRHLHQYQRPAHQIQRPRGGEPDRTTGSGTSKKSFNRCCYQYSVFYGGIPTDVKS